MGEHYCAELSQGCPEDVCCDIQTEEKCFDETGNSFSCARHDEGGCPCPAGQMKCGVSQYSSGFCTVEEYCTDRSGGSTTASKKNFKVKARGEQRKNGRGHTKRFVPFDYQDGKCLHGENKNVVLPLRGQSPPYLTGVSLKQCAKECAKYGTDCVGIGYYTDDVPRYFRDGVIVRSHEKGDCFFAATTETVDCSEYTMGKVEWYFIEDQFYESAIY